MAAQNSSTSDKGKGLDYINHKINGKKILLFVKRTKRRRIPEYNGLRLFWVKSNLKDRYGEKCMSIKWELNEPMPYYIWKESAKMAVG